MELVRFVMYNKSRNVVVVLVALFPALKWLNTQNTVGCEGGLPAIRMLCSSTFAATGNQEWKGDRSRCRDFL
jgi:hypothetical protein